MEEKRILTFSPNMMFPNYILGLSKEWLNKKYGINKEVKKDEK